ncbi:hypothetical protein GLOIN_2v1777702 [Rhizophagus irregularis DAOM 181602=DAOM 197198]|nr:hypothetical protein RirG_014370 [Rhizophagus irregularis DAOM 197198w]EXX79946.1 hypothetical protein RirG_000720 [Rhizophagus irregularis DAOM 197198w]PKY17313.1 hypothetical protein RhiirB3_429905 [Rhizophagus irregularis]PKY25719.1 hypothetical protein RhiirB3_440781 [Rhizophagus irregularis]GBC30792.1 hypothetical protein GLOIN_2v1777702 [Rhizophagus irregularis DAOM 181602=DAOM 197198]
MDNYKSRVNLAIEIFNYQVTSKCDNVAPDEVVKIIKDYRAKKKMIEYAPCQASKNESGDASKVRDKLEELEKIFMQTSNDMEWEKINRDALRLIKNEHGLNEPGQVKSCAMKSYNFMMLGQRVISMEEQSDIMREYTTLNDDFKKRLKDENRKTDEKEIGEKRPILESPPPRELKKEEVIKKVKKQG